MLMKHAAAACGVTQHHVIRRHLQFEHDLVQSLDDES